MARILLPLFILFTIVGCTSDTSNSPERPIEDSPDIVDHSVPIQVDSSFKDSNNETDEPIAPSIYSYKLIFEENKGWGYQIFEGEKMVVNQPHIPAVQGIKGFSSEKNAAITAEYILKMLEEGTFPPTVSAKTLDSLGVL